MPANPTPQLVYFMEEIPELRRLNNPENPKPQILIWTAGTLHDPWIGFPYSEIGTIQPFVSAGL